VTVEEVSDKARAKGEPTGHSGPKPSEDGGDAPASHPSEENS
jgi:hypothetical protein